MQIGYSKYRNPIPEKIACELVILPQWIILFECLSRKSSAIAVRRTLTGVGLRVCPHIT